MTGSVTFSKLPAEIKAMIFSQTEKLLIIGLKINKSTRQAVITYSAKQLCNIRVSQKELRRYISTRILHTNKYVVLSYTASVQAGNTL